MYFFGSEPNNLRSQLPAEPWRHLQVTWSPRPHLLGGCPHLKHHGLPPFSLNLWLPQEVTCRHSSSCSGQEADVPQIPLAQRRCLVPALGVHWQWKALGASNSQHGYWQHLNTHSDVYDDCVAHMSRGPSPFWSTACSAFLTLLASGDWTSGRCCPPSVTTCSQSGGMGKGQHCLAGSLPEGSLASRDWPNPLCLCHLQLIIYSVMKSWKPFL